MVLRFSDDDAIYESNPPARDQEEEIPLPPGLIQEMADYLVDKFTARVIANVHQEIANLRACLLRAFPGIFSPHPLHLISFVVSVLFLFCR